MNAFCRFCGQFSDTGDAFCPTCGYKRNTSPFQQNFEMLDGISVTFIREGGKVCSKRRKKYIKSITAYGEWKAIYKAYRDDCLGWKIEKGSLVLEEKRNTEEPSTPEREAYPADQIKRVDETAIQLTDKDLGTEWEFHQRKILIGRSLDCDLVNKNPRISRRHAEIFFEETGWHILDLYSDNGTTLNGTRLEKNKACLLTVGDEIGLPDGTVYVFDRCNFANGRQIPSAVDAGAGGDGEASEALADRFANGGKIPGTVIYRKYLGYEQYARSNRVKYWLEAPCDLKCSLRGLSQEERRAFLKWLVSTPPHATETGDLDFTLTVQ